MSFAQIVLRNSTFGIIAQVLMKVLSFIFSVVIIRQLGAEAFGQYSVIIAFVTIFSIFSDLGLNPYAVREMARMRERDEGKREIEEMFGRTIGIKMILSLITIVVIVLAAYITDRPPELILGIFLYSLLLIMFSVQGACEAVLSGYERLDITSAAKVVSQLIFVLLGAVALLIGMNYIGLILANLFGVMGMTAVCWWGIVRLDVKPKFSRQLMWRRLIRAAIPFGIIGFALGLSYKFSIVLLGYFRSDAETGFFSAAYNLVFTALVISNSFTTSLYPSLSRRSVHVEDMLPIYLRAFRYQMMISLPIAIGGWILSEQLIPFLYDAEYLTSVLAFRIIIWTVPLMFASEFLGYIVVIINKEQRVALAVTISTVVNITFNLLLVPVYGLMGAAVMTVVTEALLVAQHLITLRKMVVRVSPGFLTVFLPGVCMGIVTLSLRDVLPFLANVVISGAAYCVLLLVFRQIGKDEFSLLRKILPFKVVER